MRGGLIYPPTQSTRIRATQHIPAQHYQTNHGAPPFALLTCFSFGGTRVWGVVAFTNATSSSCVVAWYPTGWDGGTGHAPPLLGSIRAMPAAEHPPATPGHTLVSEREVFAPASFHVSDARRPNCLTDCFRLCAVVNSVMTRDRDDGARAPPGEIASPPWNRQVALIGAHSPASVVMHGGQVVLPS